MYWFNFKNRKGITGWLFSLSVFFLNADQSHAEGERERHIEVKQKYNHPETVLAFYDPKSQKIERLEINAVEKVSEHSRKNSILIEIDNRDEESWSESVINSWELNVVTDLLFKESDLRLLPKSNITISGFPDIVKFAAFYKLDKKGIQDWVCVYEAVVGKSINDNVFTLGHWICVPMDGDGKNINKSWLLHIDKNEKTFIIDKLQEIQPDDLEHLFKSYKRIEQSEVFEDTDPFRDKD
jgi:hypothetical protein